jgi:hypothetical protein
MITFIVRMLDGKKFTFEIPVCLDKLPTLNKLETKKEKGEVKCCQQCCFLN